MSERNERTAAVLGDAAVNTLAGSHAAVFGLGGVGFAAAEALVRTGIGFITVVDGDSFTQSNMNRQLGALGSTMGRLKCQVAAERFSDIGCSVKTVPQYITPANADEFDFSAYSCVIDAVDDVPAKLIIAQKCRDAGVFLISVMGTGNKLRPELLEVCDIYETRMCPLARKCRTELKKRGIDSLRVVYSPEEPIRCGMVGSAMFVPAAAGLLAAREAVMHILHKDL